VVPDSRLNRRLYNTAVAVAIFRGVREGLKRYDQSWPIGSTQTQIENL